MDFRHGCTVVAVFVLMSLPLISNASTYFFDTFNRGGGPVGNDWVEASAGSGCAQGILLNAYFNHGNNNCNALIFRTDIPHTNGVSLTTRFSAENMADRFRISPSLLSNGTAGENIIGYGVTCNGNSGICSLYDNLTEKANGMFVFNSTDTFAIQADIYPAPRNWMDVYVWNFSTGSKPLTPTLSFHNNGENYTPAANGTAYVWDTRSTKSGGIETLYMYLYQVDSFDPDPPSLSTVSISSNNTLSSVAKTGDTVTLTFEATEPVQTPMVTIAGREASVATTTGNAFTASTTMQLDDTEGLISYSIAYTDSAGNTGFTTSTTTDSTSVTYDGTPPAISITSGPSDGESTTTAAIVFEFTVEEGASVICGFDYSTTSECVSPFASTTGVGSHIFILSATDTAGNSATSTHNFSVSELIPEPSPVPVVSTSSGGGGQPVGSGPTAPGFQTTSVIPPSLPATEQHEEVPPPAIPATEPLNTSIESAPVANITAPDTTLSVENTQNLAAALQGLPSDKGFILPWWLYFLFALIFTFIAGFFIRQWSAK